MDSGVRGQSIAGVICLVTSNSRFSGVGQQALSGSWLSFGPSPLNLLFDVTKQITPAML